MPEIQSRAASLFFLASSFSSPLRSASSSVVRLLAVAVVRLVVDDDDVLERQQLAAGALQHLAFGLDRRDRLAAPLQERASDLGQLHRLALLEGVIVGDDDLGLADVRQHVGGQNLARAVVAVGIVRQQDAQPVADRDARRDDQEAAAEEIARRRAHGVDRLPGDQHRHDNHWRHHQFQGVRPFFCQVEAVETVIWLTEVAQKEIATRSSGTTSKAPIRTPSRPSPPRHEDGDRKRQDHCATAAGSPASPPSRQDFSGPARSQDAS